MEVLSLSEMKIDITREKRYTPLVSSIEKVANAELEKDAFNNKYRFFMAFLLCFSAGLGIFAITMMNPLLVSISEDIGVDVVTTGAVSGIVALFLGISTLFGSIFVGKFNSKALMIFAMTTITAGQLIVYIATSLVGILIGRSLVGLGFGIISVSSMMIYTCWFSVKERPIVISISSLSSAAFTYLGVALAFPLCKIFGNSWRHAFLSIGIMTAFATAAWVFFGRENKAYLKYAEANIKDGKLQAKKQNGLSAAIKRVDVWLLTGFAGLATIASTGLGIYLVPFFQLVRNSTPEVAANYLSIISAAGIPGFFLSGVLASALGRRKILFIPASIFAAVGIVITLISDKPFATVVGLIIFGCCNSIRTNLCSTVITELKGGSPELAAGGVSLVFGVGPILGFILPIILSTFGESLSLTQVMIVLAVLITASVPFGLLIKETGPRRNKNSEV